LLMQKQKSWEQMVFQHSAHLQTEEARLRFENSEEEQVEHSQTQAPQQLWQEIQMQGWKGQKEQKTATQS